MMLNIHKGHKFRRWWQCFKHSVHINWSRLSPPLGNFLTQSPCSPRWQMGKLHDLVEWFLDASVEDRYRYVCRNRHDTSRTISSLTDSASLPTALLDVALGWRPRKAFPSPSPKHHLGEWSRGSFLKSLGRTRCEWEVLSTGEVACRVAHARDLTEAGSTDDRGPAG